MRHLLGFVLVAALATGCSESSGGEPESAVGEDDIEATAKPLAFAAIAHGANRVVFSKPMEPWATVETSDAALVAKVIGAFVADEVPDPKASFMRCPPAFVVSLYEETTELASIGLSCDEAATGIIQGSLTTGSANGPYGAVHVDAGVVLEVQRSLAPR